MGRVPASDICEQDSHNQKRNLSQVNKTVNSIPLGFICYLHFKNITCCYKYVKDQTARVRYLVDRQCCHHIALLKCFQLSTAIDQAQPLAASMLHDERLSFPKETNQLLEIPLHAVPGRDALELRRVQRASGDDRVQVVRGC